MKVHLLTAGRIVPAKVPYDGSAYVVLSGPCPACAAPECRVSGLHIYTTTRDTYESSAVARCCGANVGTLVLTVSTIFGIEEDERMLNGRARVY